MRSFAAVAAAISLGPRRVAGGGANDCPCLTSFPTEWATKYVNGNCQRWIAADYMGAGTSQADICYAADYGLSNCQNWDSGLAPYCTSSTPPSWCSDAWCFVDPNNCAKTDATPSPRQASTGMKVSYSYATCGVATNYAKYMRGALLTATEIVDKVASYVADLRDFVENQAAQIKSGTGDFADLSVCSGFVDSCSCPGCVAGTGTWQPVPGTQGATGYDVDFRVLSVTHTGKTSKITPAEKVAHCLARLTEGKFKQVARLEYNDPSRMAFLQYGDQSSAVYMSWPGTKWCPTVTSPFDPRYRPWYVSAVSGPKDVVIVLDRSFSMNQQNRWSSARDATKQVLDTLTPWDRVNVVLFSGQSNDVLIYDPAGGNTEQLYPMTPTHRAGIRAWLDNETPSGGTSFLSGFTKAFNLLKTSDSTDCNKAILFLTDGMDGSGITADEVAALNTVRAAVFTFSFGSNADTKLPKAIACQNKGIWYHVDDGEDIARYMSDYFLYYGAALASKKQIRWTMYSEFNTKNQLMTGCLPAFDRSGSIPKLMGVVCMDVSFIIETSLFLGKPDFQAAEQNMIAAAKVCNMASLSDNDIEQLRIQVKPESSCAYTPIANTASRLHGAPLLGALLLVVAALPRASRTRAEAA